MCGKVQESGLSEVAPFDVPAPQLPGARVLLSSVLTPLRGHTQGGRRGRGLMAAASFVYSELVCLLARVLSRVRLSATPWNVACQSPLSGTSQAGILEWGAMPSSRGSSDPGIQPRSLVSPPLAGGFFTTKPPGKPF